jgi:hypothetical protein
MPSRRQASLTRHPVDQGGPAANAKAPARHSYPDRPATCLETRRSRSACASAGTFRQHHGLSRWRLSSRDRLRRYTRVNERPINRNPFQGLGKRAPKLSKVTSNESVATAAAEHQSEPEKMRPGSVVLMKHSPCRDRGRGNAGPT